MWVEKYLPNANVWVMAFDFGETRIGIAIGNTLLKIPHPLQIVTGRNKFEKFDKIRKLIDEWKPTILLVGMPGNPDPQVKINITRFYNRLKHNFELNTSFINEDYTSSVASSKLNEQGVRGIAQKTKLDALAACAILQTYFDRCETNVI